MARIMLTKQHLLHMVKQYKHERSSYFVDAAACKPKQIQNAIKSYAPGVKPEDVIALLDRTLFGSAKDGFLLTRTHMYGDMLNGKTVELNQLQSVVRESDFVVVKYFDGRKDLFDFDDLSSDLHNFLTFVAKASEELQNIAPKRGAELLEQGMEAFRKKDYRAAERAFRESVYFGNTTAKAYLRQLLAMEK